MSSLTSIPRLYPDNPSYQEGASCAISTITGVPTKEYCAIGAPRFGSNSEEFIGKVNMYKRAFPGDDWVFYQSLIPNAEITTNLNFFGFNIKYVYLNGIIHIAVAAPQFHTGTDVNPGYIEFFEAETGTFVSRLEGSVLERNYGYGMSSNVDNESQIFSHVVIYLQMNWVQLKEFMYI